MSGCLVLESFGEICNEQCGGDWDKCPFTAILRALPTAGGDRLKVSLSALQGQMDYMSSTMNTDRWVVSTPMEDGDE